MCPRRGGFGDRGAPFRVAFCERLGEIELGHDVKARRPGQGEGALEKSGSRAIVASPGGGAAGRCEPHPCAFGQRRVGLAELLLVSHCLLEVVADDLVPLDQLAAALFDPARIALVQVRACGLGQSTVCRVTDQQVAKTEPILTRQLWPLGTNQLSPRERREAWRQLQFLGHEDLNGTAVEQLTFDRGSLEHSALACVELVEPRREQRLQRRGHVDVRVAFAGQGQHLPDEQRVAGGRGGDSFPKICRHARRDQRVGARSVAQRREPKRHRPARAAVEEIRPSHAEDQDRRAAREERHMLDRDRERSLRPIERRRTTPTTGACSSSELAERPGNFVRRGPFVAAEERTNRRRSRRVGGQYAQLLHDLDDGPVGDAGAVGRAASTNDASVYSSKRFRDEA